MSEESLVWNEKEEEFYKWLNETYHINLAESSIIAQFLMDIKKANTALTPNEPS